MEKILVHFPCRQEFQGGFVCLNISEFKKELNIRKDKINQQNVWFESGAKHLTSYREKRHEIVYH